MYKFTFLYNERELLAPCYMEYFCPIKWHKFPAICSKQPLLTVENLLYCYTWLEFYTALSTVILEYDFSFIPVSNSRYFNITCWHSPFVTVHCTSGIQHFFHNWLYKNKLHQYLCRSPPWGWRLKINKECSDLSEDYSFTNCATVSLDISKLNVFVLVSCVAFACFEMP